VEGQLAVRDHDPLYRVAEAQARGFERAAECVGDFVEVRTVRRDVDGGGGCLTSRPP